jgi:hypothetical protein
VPRFESFGDGPCCDLSVNQGFEDFHLPEGKLVDETGHLF